MKSGGTNDVAPVAVTAGIVAVWELAVVIFQIPGCSKAPGLQDRKAETI